LTEGSSKQGSSNKAGRSSKTRRASRRRKSSKSEASQSSKPNIINSGGCYLPLDQASCEQIHRSALELLNKVGFSGASESVTQLVLARGGYLLDNDRLAFPETLVDDAIAGLRRDITLFGQTPGHELDLFGQRVHVGTGGAAPLVIDLRKGHYRSSTLGDLYDAARLVDTLDNIQFFSRSVVATDMPDDLTLDINTAYASLAGCRKHAMVSATSVASVSAIAEMCSAIAGTKSQFTDHPFLSLNINHVVSPLRLSATDCDVLVEAARIGIPVNVNTFSQLGASTPVTIAGCLSQTVAETLAGMVIAWLANPDVMAIFGPRPMITDLRTGGMAGGAGEQALLTAVAAQMANYYGFPCSTIAGATDSKIADAQSGYEKSLSVTLAAHAGCNLITQACGMQAGLMACSLESYVVDNDMLGAILRSLEPVEVNQQTLSTEEVAAVVVGEGHFLGRDETFKRMQTDFLYPDIADRTDHEVWAENGSKDIRTVANATARDIINEHYPSHIPQTVDKDLRRRFNIQLPERDMQATFTAE